MDVVDAGTGTLMLTTCGHGLVRYLRVSSQQYTRQTSEAWTRYVESIPS